MERDRRTAHLDSGLWNGVSRQAGPPFLRTPFIYRGTFPVIIPVGLAANALSPIHSFALPFAREKAPQAAVFGVFCQETRKYDIKMQFFPRKVWWEPKFVIPLHPLSGTNVPGAYEKRSLRRFT